MDEDDDYEEPVICYKCLQDSDREFYMKNGKFLCPPCYEYTINRPYEMDDGYVQVL